MYQLIKSSTSSGAGRGGEGECISNSHVKTENATYLINPQNSLERQFMPVKDSLW